MPSTIDLAEVVLVSTVDAVDALAGTVTAVSDSFEAGTAAIDDIASLADTLGPSLTDAGTTVRTLERVGGQVDSVLEAVSSLPVVPSYDSENGLGATFGRLADTLEELRSELDLEEGQPNASAIAEILQDLIEQTQAVMQSAEASAEQTELSQLVATLDNLHRQISSAQ